MDREKIVFAAMKPVDTMIGAAVSALDHTIGLETVSDRFYSLAGVVLRNMYEKNNDLREEGRPLREALIEGCLLRLRPVLMTASTTILGLLPLLLSRGIGSEVQRPLAVVVIFGLASSTALTLFVIPAVYGWLERRQTHDEA